MNVDAFYGILLSCSALIAGTGGRVQQLAKCDGAELSLPVRIKLREGLQSDFYTRKKEQTFFFSFQGQIHPVTWA